MYRACLGFLCYTIGSTLWYLGKDNIAFLSFGLAITLTDHVTIPILKYIRKDFIPKNKRVK